MATILVVDDDSQVIEQTIQLISEAGHRADFLLEAQYLIMKLEAEPVDLILLDVNMPEVDGLTLLERLRDHATLCDTPVIMITGETDEKLIALCFEKGAVDFVKKPIRPLELTSRITIALATQAHIQAIQQQRSQLQKAKTFTDTILNSIEDALCVVDSQKFEILEANTIFQQQVGKSREELIGQRFITETELAPQFQCFAPGKFKENKKKCSFRETAQTGQTVIIESLHDFSDGQPRYLKTITTPIKDENNQTYQIIFTARDITQRKLLEERLKHLAFHDALTALPNRQLFFDRLEQAIAQARRHDQMVAVLFFDLDRFKAINDTLGHGIGDLLLQEVASRLLHCVRESDTVARMGGDEFTAVLTNLKDIYSLLEITDKLLKYLEKTYHLEEHDIKVTSSIGVSLYPYDGDSLKELTSNADQALYKAKSKGRNNVQFYSNPKKIEKHKNKKKKK
ncbi:MAG: diguanylate cyclase [Magnetococcales bacterium]|nr:diguanylate cyclase [Magnetococcales bacterium]